MHVTVVSYTMHVTVVSYTMHVTVVSHTLVCCLLYTAFISLVSAETIINDAFSYSENV